MNLPKSYHVNIIGDFGVGKTSIINSFKKLGFQDKNTTSTIGINNFLIPIKFENKEIILNVYDTSGQEKYQSLTLNSIRNCEGLILVYDRSDYKTFENICKVWIKSINEVIDLILTPCILVENKCDLVLDSEIKEEKINEIIKQYSLKFIRTSVIDNKNIKEIFYNLAEMIINKKNQILIFDEKNNIDEVIYMGFVLVKEKLKDKKKKKHKKCQ
jgi:small GTP-binding protein